MKVSGWLAISSTVRTKWWRRFAVYDPETDPEHVVYFENDGENDPLGSVMLSDSCVCRQSTRPGANALELEVLTSARVYHVQTAGSTEQDTWMRVFGGMHPRPEARGAEGGGGGEPCSTSLTAEIEALKRKLAGLEAEVAKGMENTTGSAQTADEPEANAPNLSPDEEEWLCSLFSDEGAAGGSAASSSAARKKFFKAVALVSKGGSNQNEKLMDSKDPGMIQSLRFADGGAAFFELLAEAISEQNELEQNAAAVKTSPKDAGQFKFGNQRDFQDGVQGIIGVSPSQLFFCCCLTFFVFESGTTGSRANQAASFPTPSATA